MKNSTKTNNQTVNNSLNGLDIDGDLRDNAGTTEVVEQTTNTTDKGVDMIISQETKEKAIKKAVRLQDRVLTRLFKRFAKKAGIKVHHTVQCTVVEDEAGNVTFDCDAEEKLVAYAATTQVQNKSGKLEQSFSEEAALESAFRIRQLLNSDEFLAFINDEIIPNVALHHGAKYIAATRKLALRRNMNIHVPVLNFVYNEKLERIVVTKSVNVMDENEAIRTGFINPKPYNFNFGLGHYERFTKDLVILNFQDAPKECIENTEIYVYWNGLKTKFLRKDNLFDIYTDMETEETFDASKVTLRKYEITGQSPSSIKKFQTLAFDVTNGYDRVENMLNRVSNGAYNKDKGKAVTIEKISKYVARFFAWTAPNVSFGKIKHNAITMGKIRKGALDGFAMMSSESTAKLLTAYRGVKVVAQDIEGYGYQNRPWTAKTFSFIVPNELIKEAINVLGEVIYLPTVTDDDKLNLDLAFQGKANKWFNPQAEKELAKKENRDEKLYTFVFGTKSDTIDFWSDINGYKVEYDWGCESSMRILDMAKPGICHTSLQMLDVLLDSENCDSYHLIGLLKEIAGEDFQPDYDDILAKDFSVPSYNEVSKSLYPHNVLNCIAPDYIRNKDFSSFRRLIDTVVKRQVSAVNNFKFKIDGVFARLISDPVKLIDPAGVLKEGEIFSPDAEIFFNSKEAIEKYTSREYYEKKKAEYEATHKDAYYLSEDDFEKIKKTFEDRIITMYKYPKMGTKEFYKARAVSFIEIKRRINDNSKLTKKQKELFIDAYKSTKNGCVILPGIALIMKLCAGSDFDYDGAALVFDARFNTFTSNIVVIVDMNVKSKCRTQTWSLGVDVFKKAIIENSKLDSLGVGPITNCNESQIDVLAMYHFARTPEKKQEAVNVMKYITRIALEKRALAKNQIYEGNNKTGVYTSGLTIREIIFAGKTANVVEVDELGIYKCFESISLAELNEENLVKFFIDLNYIFRFYQEATIDSSKTGIPVNVEMTPGANIVPMSRLKYKYTLQLDNTGAVALSFLLSENKKQYNDFFGLVREGKLLYIINSNIKRVVKEKCAETAFAYDETELTWFNKFKNSIPMQPLNYAFAELKKMYGTAYAVYANEKEITGNDEEALAICTDGYKKDIEAIHSLGRNLIDYFCKKHGTQMTPELIGDFVKFISLYKLEKGVFNYNGNKDSQFASMVFPYEYFSCVINHYASMDFCGSKLIYNYFYKDGDEVEFKNGIAEYATVAEDLNGIFTIKEFNGELYATRKILDSLKEQADSNNTIILRSQEEIDYIGECYIHCETGFNEYGHMINAFELMDKNGIHICDIIGGLSFIKKDGSKINLLAEYYNDKHINITKVKSIPNLDSSLTLITADLLD